jgi:hypothetical protein
MNNYTNIFKKNKKNNQLALIISFMIFLSFPPWPVWGLGEWNMRIISLITLIIALNILTIRNIKQNFLLAILYLISILYIRFGGLKGYILPTHVEFTMFILLLALSKGFLIMVLDKFEKLITILFILGIGTYLIGMVINLPSFSIPPLNASKIGNYKVHIFDLELLDYTVGNSRKFMSVFDEPGVVGTLVALIISYRKLEFNKIKDIILIVAGLISFSLAFYIVLLINLLYNRTLNLKFYLIFVIILFSFYYVNPEFVKVALFDRFIVGDNIGIVDNRATETFNDEYDSFVKKGGAGLFFGLGPNALAKLSKDIEINVSSYKTLIYQFGILGAVLFISFFFYATYKFAPVKRGWFFFIIFLALAWQRPGVFTYFNLLIYLSGLSYISAIEIYKSKVKLIQETKK